MFITSLLTVKVLIFFQFVSNMSLQNRRRRKEHTVFRVTKEAKTTTKSMYFALCCCDIKLLQGWILN